MGEETAADRPSRSSVAQRVGRGSPRVRWRLLPWWARVVIVYVAARAVSIAIVLQFAHQQPANAWTGARPGYFEYANIWDGRWYAFIAAAGYPTELPLTEEGRVAENAWAFLPVFPGIVRVFAVVGVPWDVASVVVSLVAGLAAALVFHRLMSRFLEPDQALFAVVLFCVAPVSPIMGFGYAEALGFLWLALALLLLVDRRYGWLVPVVAIWAFTRPGALAFALALGLHWIVRWFTRSRDPFPVRERVVAASVALFAALVGLAWPAIAWAFTGEPAAYTDTELAWRAPYIGHVELVPLTPWFQSGDWWLGQPMGTILPIALVVGFGVLLFTPWVRRLGVDVRLWLASYALYLLAVFFPQSSTFRLLAPLFPILGAFAVPRSPWWRGSLVAISIALQVVWLRIGWFIDVYDWTPP